MDKELLESYKKTIELFLGTSGVYKGIENVNKDSKNLENEKTFIRDKVIRMKAGNVDEKILDQAIDELLPYLIMRESE